MEVISSAFTSRQTPCAHAGSSKSFSTQRTSSRSSSSFMVKNLISFFRLVLKSGEINASCLGVSMTLDTMNVLEERDDVLWVENDLLEPAWAQGVWRDVKALEI